MVSSLDGFIASADGSISWMKTDDNYDKGVELDKQYISDFLKSIDCYVMGSKTYEHTFELGWPYGDKPVIVLTTRQLPAVNEHVSFYSGDLEELIQLKLSATYKNIWMVGGAALTKEFLKMNLADEIVITILPIILGEGLPFFDKIEEEHKLHLTDVKAFKDGMVELSYQIIKE